MSPASYARIERGVPFFAEDCKVTFENAKYIVLQQNKERAFCMTLCFWLRYITSGRTFWMILLPTSEEKRRFGLFNSLPQTKIA